MAQKSSLARRSRRRLRILRRAKSGAAGTCRAATPKARTVKASAAARGVSAARAKAIKGVKPDPREQASRRAAERSRSHDRKLRRLQHSWFEHLTSHVRTHR